MPPTADAGVASALRQHASDYLDHFGDRVPLGHRKVLSYVTRCRTGQLGNVVYRCRSCEARHWVGRSCGNRHCPNCQKQKTTRWLEGQIEILLPVQHFVVTFTVPQELRSLLRAHQRAGYEAIFQAGSRTIRKLLANPRNLGSDKLGFFGVLHTWGRDPMTYHPHVHFVVPGGGVNQDGSKWMQVKPDRLFHPMVAMKLYKKFFTQSLRKAGLYSELPYGVLKLNWVVNIKPVGGGQAVLKYLAPYIYRVAISDSRIESIDPNGVTYRVKPSGKRSWVKRQVSGREFVRGFVQHVLPNGFQKVRYYGFMSPNCKLQLQRVRWLVWLYRGWCYWLGAAQVELTARPPRRPKCDRCGGELEVVAVTNRSGQVIYSNWRSTSDRSSRAPPCAA